MTKEIAFFIVLFQLKLLSVSANQHCCFPFDKKEDCCQKMEYFSGAKMFFTLKLTKIPWGTVLADHYSGGYRHMSREIIRESKFLGPTPDSVYKILEYSPLSDGILVKIMLRIPNTDVINQLPHSLMININNDISFGLLGSKFDVDPKSLQVHDIIMSTDSTCCAAFSDENGKPKEKWQKELEDEENERQGANVNGRIVCRGTKHRFLLRFPDVEWKEDYSDRESEAFQDLVKDLNKGGNSIHLEGPEFVGFDVISVGPAKPKGILVKIQNKLVVTVDFGSDDYVYRALAHFVTITDICVKKEKFGSNICDQAIFIGMEEATGKGGKFYVDEIKPGWENNCEVETLPEGPLLDSCCQSQYETICCPEKCCSPDIHVQGCCNDPTENEEKGVKLFVSVIIQKIPWSVSLDDVYSTGYKTLTLRLHKEMEFLYPINDTRMKVVKFEEDPKGIKAKMLVWIPKIERGPLYVKAFIDSVNNDIIPGKIGENLFALPGSAQVYHKEEGTYCCHNLNEIAKDGCCKDKCCKNGFARVPCCKDDDDDDEDLEGPSEDLTNQQTMSKPFKICSGMIQRFSLRLKDQTWSKDLEDTKSEAFKTLAENFENEFLPLFMLSPTVSGIKIIGVRQADKGICVKFQVHELHLAEYSPQTFVIDAITAWMTVVEAATSGQIGKIGAVDELKFVHVRAGPTVMFKVNKKVPQSLKDLYCNTEYHRENKYSEMADETDSCKELLF